MDINQNEISSASNSAKSNFAEFDAESSLTNQNSSGLVERDLSESNARDEYKDWSNLKVKMLKVKRLTKGRNF